MDAVRGHARWTAVLLAISMVSGGLLPTPGLAQTGPGSSTGALPSLALPADVTLSTDAALEVIDTAAVMGSVDLTALVDDAVATAEALPAAEWEVDALAATLADDPAAAFRTVRDRIAFEPYPGALRGADGTLAARAGSSFDRALLLAAVLDVMGVRTRFAFGQLDDDTAATLVAHALDPIAEPLQDAGPLAGRTLDLDAIATRARRDHALLRGALGSADVVLGGPSGDDTIPDVRAHAWVQVEQDGVWIDHDPSLPGLEPGDTLTPITTTSDVMPDTAWQSVGLRLEAETLTDGVLDRTPVLDHVAPAATLEDSEVFLYFQPDQGGGGLLFGASAEEGSFVPLLMIDGEVTAGDAFSVLDASGDDGGFGFGLGGGGGGGTAFAGLWLTVTTTAPDADPIVTTIPLVDRVPDATRASGLVAVEDLAVLPASDAGPLAMGAIRHLMVGTGGANPRAAAIGQADAMWWAGTELLAADASTEYPLGDLLWPLAVADDTITLVLERLLVPAIGRAGVVAPVIGRPRLVVTTFGADPAGGELLQLDIDLVLDGLRLVAAPDADPTDLAHRRLWYGALGSALETEVMRQTAVSTAGDALLMSTSLAMGGPLSVLTSDAAAALPPTTPATLRGSLAEGLLAVVPGDPAGADTWWTIGPADGTTRAILAPSGGASRGTRVGPFNSGGGTRMIQPSQTKVWDLDPPKRRPLPVKGRAGCRGGNEYIAIVGCVSAPTSLVISQVSIAITGYCAFRILNAIRG
ncbi:MAG: hypothetical protein KF809_01660 [Chloroflexi bacterium]|nr:hypothetical protein [Chloroflexota bacterium]